MFINGQVVKRTHRGIDFACPKETHIKAIAGGRAKEVGFENPQNEDHGFGYRIWQESEIDGKKLWIAYAHLRWSMVGKDFTIDEGEYIALSGNTGAVEKHPEKGLFGYHLHLEAREANTRDYYNLEFYGVPT